MTLRQAKAFAIDFAATCMGQAEAEGYAQFENINDDALREAIEEGVEYATFSDEPTKMQVTIGGVVVTLTATVERRNP